MLVYKGVAPGTHHFAKNPKRVDFRGDPGQPTEIDDVVRHITAHSWPSAWVSVSMSFAIAADYATRGGRVYEIRLSDIGENLVLDPVAKIVEHSNRSLKRFVHFHDGHQDLTGALGDPARSTVLTTFPLRPAAPPAPKPPAPSISGHLHAITFATRDAELLLKSVPSSALGLVYNVP